MKRREARIARQHVRALKNKEKHARFVEGVVSEHSPRALFDPDHSRTARSRANPDSIMQMQMSYDLFECAYREGAWSWGQDRNWCSPEARASANCLVRRTMGEMGQLNWAEILSQTTGGRDRHKKHHAQSWDRICPEAQGRWIEIGRTEDELFRFRTGGRERIWGIRLGSTFLVVWWDPEHQIYPV